MWLTVRTFTIFTASILYTFVHVPSQYDDLLCKFHKHLFSHFSTLPVIVIINRCLPQQLIAVWILLSMWLCLVHSSSGNAGTSSAPVLSTYSHCGYPTLLFTMPNLCMGTSGPGSRWGFTPNLRLSLVTTSGSAPDNVISAHVQIYT